MRVCVCAAHIIRACINVYDEILLGQVLPESTFTHNQTENRTINTPGEVIQPQLLCGVVAREPGWCGVRLWVRIPK